MIRGMGFLSWLRGDDLVEARDAQTSIGDPALREYLGLGHRNYAGVDVTESSSLGLTAVWRAVSIVSGTIAGLPLKSYRTDSDGMRERVPTFLDNPAGPDGLATPLEWVELVMVHLLLHGNAYLRHLYNGAGALIGLEPLHPSIVEVKCVDDPWQREYSVAMKNGTREIFTPLDLTHVLGLGTDGVKGLSPIQVMRQAIGTGLAGDEAAARMFGSGNLLGGLVSSDEAMTQTQAEEIQADWDARMAGTSNAGRVRVINAALKFTPWTMNAIDAQFLESRSHQVEEVCRIFGVPPHLVGLTEKQTSWGTGVSEQNRGLARFTLAPWTSRLEQKLSRLLSRPTTCEFDYAGLLQPSPDEEIHLLIEQYQAGVITLDEYRRIRNMAPLAKPAPAPTEEEPAV